jgi:hypothetical protein
MPMPPFMVHLMVAALWVSHLSLSLQYGTLEYRNIVEYRQGNYTA